MKTKDKKCDQQCKNQKEKTKCCYYSNNECLLKGDIYD